MGIDQAEHLFLHQGIDAPGAGAVTDGAAVAAVLGVAGVIGSAAVIADAHAPGAVLAIDDALQQTGSLPGRSGMGQVAGVGGQGMLVVLKFGQRNIARMVVGQEHLPVRPLPAAHVRLVGEGIVLALAPAVAVDARIAGVGQHRVERFIRRRLPADLATEPAAGDLMGQFQARLLQVVQHRAHRTQLLKEAKHQGEGMPHALVRRQADPLGRRIAIKAYRQQSQQLAPAGFIEPPALQPRPNLIELDFGDGAPEPQQQAVVEVAGIVDAVLIGDERVEGGGQFQQLIPIQIVARQARDLQAEDQAHLAQRQHRQQALVAGPIVAVGAGEAQIVIDHHTARRGPTQGMRPLHQLILAVSAFVVLRQLPQRRLANVDHRLALLMGCLNLGITHGEDLRRGAAPRKTGAH